MKFYILKLEIYKLYALTIDGKMRSHNYVMCIIYKFYSYRGHIYNFFHVL